LAALGERVGGAACFFLLSQLKQFPSRSQITEHICEEGWSYAAEFTGVSLSYLMNLVGILPQARAYG
jgi:DMSO/TMAO reductase YedYZ molybdopterin-dependent catalytic subunit